MESVGSARQMMLASQLKPAGRRACHCRMRGFTLHVRADLRLKELVLLAQGWEKMEAGQAPRCPSGERRRVGSMKAQRWGNHTCLV